ncbi:MAG TPA: hypothetical protein PK781_07555, partial [Terrimesophilobacter sp.]|nr:hypothetical protein [Terrimesophilobacter sp.]
MNPFDEIAVEEAVRLKEKGAASEIVATIARPHESLSKAGSNMPRAPGVRLNEPSGTRLNRPCAAVDGMVRPS